MYTHEPVFIAVNASFFGFHTANPQYIYIYIEEYINHLGIDIYQHNSIDVVIKQLCSIKTAIGEPFGTCAEDALDINVKLNLFYKLTFCMISVQPFIEFIALSNYDYKYLISKDIS